MPFDVRVVLDPKTLDELESSRRDSLLRTLESSGTASRLGHAGMSASEDPVALAPDAVGAQAAFRTTDDEEAIADVYLFDDHALLTAAYGPLSEASPGEHVRVTQNGAFLVRVRARSEGRLWEIVGAIAGEE
jgi:hypothetical protein